MRNLNTNRLIAATLPTQVRTGLALAAVFLCLTSLCSAGENVFSIHGDQLLLNNQPFKIIGLRCSNAIISDQCTDDLIKQLPIYKDYGVNTVSVFFMGSRFGDVKGYRPDATLDRIYARRMGRIIEAADRHGMVVLVGCLYWSESRAKEDLAKWKQVDANRAVANTVRWLKQHNYRNVLVDPDNEGMAHDANGWSISVMIAAGHSVDSTIMIAYNDHDPPPDNANLYIHHSPKVAGKPWLDSEATPRSAPGGYWGKFSKETQRKSGGKYYNYSRIGRYTEKMKAEQLRRTEEEIRRYNGHMLASTWLQCPPSEGVGGPFVTPGGHSQIRDIDADIDQLHEDAGIAWWLDFIKEEYGPWQAPRASGAGSEGDSKQFFTAKNISGKWHIIDPNGKPFFLRGVNHYGDFTHMPWVRERYSSSAAWRASIRDRVREWGFNYLPPSIGPSAIDPKTIKGERTRSKLITRTPEWPPAHYAELDFPFTIFLEYPRQYMAGANLPDVFSEDFAQAVDKRCREVCLPLKDNRNLIGYHFCHNPPWHPRVKSFDLWIESCVKPGSAGRAVWSDLMRRIYGTVERWRETYGVPIERWSDIEELENPLRGYISQRRLLADKEAFMRLICERWYRTYHDAIRKHDSNHLIFGDRNTLHLQPLPAYAISIMSKYVDVLSVNVMGPRPMIYGVLEDATRNWDGPIHLADTGACIFSLGTNRSGYQAKDLAEFEAVYSGLVKMGVEHPQIVGLGWCGFYETPPPGARGGIVDVRTGDPLRERLEVIQRWNSWMDAPAGP